MQNHFWNHHVIGIANTNCYIFGNPKEAIIVDPGGEEAISLCKKLIDEGIEVKHILVSHGHFDHLGWAPEVQKLVEGARVYLHKDEKSVYEEFLDWMPQFGLPSVDLREPDVWLEHGQTLDLSGYQFEVWHTPGHSPGSATYVVNNLPNEIDIEYIPIQREASAFVGDCIFEGSIGRVDLPYSSKGDMLASLKLLMEELVPRTQLYPGHGNTTFMEKELQQNPFLKAIQNGIAIF